MAPLIDKQRAKQLRKEHAAMLSHYALMRGLVIISDIRLGKYFNLVEDQRAKEQTEDEALRAIRQAIREEASLDPKARMLFDVDRELDLYAWGPMQLFFCVACAYLDRYQYLRDQHPNLAFADLDRYIEENSAGLNAIKELRDWVLHPGTSRLPDKAMVMLFSVQDGWSTAYPLKMVYRLLDLAAKFLEMLGGQTR